MEWKPVVGYEGIYEVRPGSDGGRVRRVCKLARTRIGRELGKRDSAGYWRAVLSKPKEKPAWRRLHTLILEAFIGPCPEGHEACHKDDNKDNNTLGNLYWGTRSSNLRDSVSNLRHGSVVKPESYLRGEKHPNSKLTNMQTQNIRDRRLRGEKLKILAQEFGISEVHVSRIARGESRL